MATCLATSLFYSINILVGGLDHFLFSIIYGMSSFPLTFIFFRGVAQPPTSIHLSCLPCQEGGQLEQFKLMQDRSKGSNVWRITKSSLLPQYNMSRILQSSMPQCQSKTCSHLMSFVFIYIYNYIISYIYIYVYMYISIYIYIYVSIYIYTHMYFYLIIYILPLPFGRRDAPGNLRVSTS